MRNVGEKLFNLAVLGSVTASAGMTFFLEGGKLPKPVDLGVRTSDNCALPDGAVRVVADEGLLSFGTALNDERLALMVDARGNTAQNLPNALLAFEAVSCAVVPVDLDGDGFKEPLRDEVKDTNAAAQLEDGVLTVLDRGNDMAKVEFKGDDTNLFAPHVTQAERNAHNDAVTREQALLVGLGISSLGLYGMKERNNKIRRLKSKQRAVINRQKELGKECMGILEDIYGSSKDWNPEQQGAATMIKRVYLNRGFEAGDKLVKEMGQFTGGLNTKSVAIAADRLQIKI